MGERGLRGWGAWPVLQVAFDQTDLKEALRVAKRVVRAGRLWLEVGTPLIKAEGVRAVAKFRKLFPQHFIVADLKTFDAGWVEAELAVKAGADMVSVLGAAGDETISDVVETCKKMGARALVDLMSVEDVAGRARRAEELGADAILVHVGFGSQRRGRSAMDALDVVRKVLNAVKIPVGVAGGIKHGAASTFANAGCKIIIVGGAITGASDPADAAKVLLEELITASERP